MGLIQDKLKMESQPAGTAPSGSLMSAVEQNQQSASQTQVTPTSIIKKLATKYMNFSQNLGEVGAGALKGVASTIRGAGQIGTKIEDALSRGVEKVGGPANLFPTSDVYKPETATGAKVVDLLKPTNTAQSIGKGAEQIGEFFIPAAKVGMVEKVLSEGGKVLSLAKLTPLVGETAAKIISKITGLGLKVAVRAGESGGVISLQTGGDAQATKTAAEFGGALPVVGAALKPVAGFAGDVVNGFGKRLAGALTGRGTAVIDELVKDPRAAMQGLTGESMDVLSKDARLIKEASVQMKAEAGKEYNRVINNLQEIYDNEMKPSGFVFDKGTEINKITDILKEKFGIQKAGDVAKATGKVDNAGKLDFESSRFLPKEATIIERAMNIVRSFRDPLTPKSLESLASKLDKLKSESPSAVEVNSAVHAITTSLRESVAEMGAKAGYQEGADLARNYAQAMDKLDNFNSLFRSSSEDLRPNTGTEVKPIPETRAEKPVILPETEKTKIIQDLSTLFSGNKDVDKNVLRKMIFGGQEIISREAGRTLATATEKASTKLGDLIREAVITPIIPPKTIGKIVAKTALSSAKVTTFLNQLRELSPLAKGAVVELISKHNQ